MTRAEDIDPRHVRWLAELTHPDWFADPDQGHAAGGRRIRARREAAAVLAVLHDEGWLRVDPRKPRE